MEQREPWVTPPPARRRQMEQLEGYYRSLCAQVETQANAVSASYGGPHIQVGHGEGKRTEAKHAPVIHAAIDALREAYPLHLRLYAVPALDLIYHNWATAIRVCWLQGVREQEFAAVVRKGGISPSTAHEWLVRGLWALVHLLWDDASHPIVPDELK